jgi:hypothetical protein
MLAYKYDKDTKEYLGTQNAQIDPLGKGYLLPANATFIKAPNYEGGNIPVFDIEQEKWGIETDHRKHYQVKLDDVTFSIVNYIGDAQEGYQFITDEVYEKYQADSDRFEVIDGVFTDIIGTPEYIEKKRKKEKERVSHLKCTKRVFVLMLEQLGLDYFEQIEPKINANRQAKLEWELCVELERSNPLLDSIGGELGITPKQLDDLFKYANGEITQEEFRGA